MLFNKATKTMCIISAACLRLRSGQMVKYIDNENNEKGKGGGKAGSPRKEKRKMDVGFAKTDMVVGRWNMYVYI